VVMVLSPVGQNLPRRGVNRVVLGNSGKLLPLFPPRGPVLVNRVILATRSKRQLLANDRTY